MITQEGLFPISDDLTVGPGFPETDFLASSIASDAEFDGANDGYSRYGYRGVLENGLAYGAMFYFLNGRLNTISFRPIWPGSSTSWRDWSEERELKDKELNDKLLLEYLGPPPYEYRWGAIESDYDPRGGSSGITINYLLE